MDSIRAAEEEMHLKESLDKFIELGKKGIEISGDSIQVSAEFLILLNNKNDLL